MNYRLLYLIGIILMPSYLYGADNPAAIALLNLRGSTYTPGGEPAPLMVWVPKAEIKEGGYVSDYISYAMVCFFKMPPKTVKQARTRCNDFTMYAYSADKRVKVAVGQDDMQKIIDSLKLE